ncbi:MAG: hypothetical protein CVV22_05310 [Ignavibacteriae bacterium HGW-Ignavibacteriae-1]|nr:MAG: hypothetical protein CVV22_05310 [Ignavibacteriae bacterium HGW-Ignavibacteriae-1]
MICVGLLLLVTTSRLSGSDENIYYIGVSAGSNYIYNSTEKPYIKSDPKCGEFDTGTAQGINAALKLGFRLIPGVISLEGRLMFDNRPFSMTGSSDCFEVLDPVSDEYVPFVRSHYYDGVLDYVILDLGVNIYPISAIPVALRLSFDAGNPLVKTDFTLRESVASPSSVAFSDGSQSRMNESSELKTASTSLGAGAALMYNMYLGDNWSVDFELGYRYGINSALSDIEQKSDIVRANAGFSYHFGGTKPEIPKRIEPEIKPIEKEIEPIAEIIPPKEKIILSASANPIHVKETIVTQTFPILPYYFFDENSEELDNKYFSNISASSFDEQNLNKETMTIYYNSLDIIGKRLSKSDSKLRIMGYSDGKENATIDERKSLAESRAKSIANYFTSKWNIPRERLIIESGDIPSNHTNFDYEEAASENRRVELFSENPEILAPVLHSQFSEYNYNPEDLHFNIELNRNAKLEYQIETSDRNYFSNKIQKEIDSRNYKANYNVKSDIFGEIITKSKSENIKLVVNAESKDTTEKYEIPLNINIETEKFEIGRLNLIVFDFDKATMSDPNRNLVAEFSKDAIKPNSDIYITGTTDMLGGQEYNMSLSQRRADNTQQIINSVLPDTKFVNVVGIGSDKPRYDNKLPEGRFYNRTVLIEVKTPIDKIN